MIKMKASKRFKRYAHLNNFEAILADDLRIAEKRDRSQRGDDPGVEFLDLGVPKPIRKKPRFGSIVSQRFCKESL